MQVTRLIILVVLTVIMAFAGYHFFGSVGAIGGTVIGVVLIIAGARV